MAAGLRALGVPVADEPGGDWVVDGQPGVLRPPDDPARVELGNAGTVARFLTAAAALATGLVVLDGDPRMRERPVAPLLAALRGLGADLDDTAGGFPVTVRGRGGLAGGTVTVDASASSQLVSGLLLVAPRARGPVTIRHEGPPLPSEPYLAMTVQALRERGVAVTAGGTDGAGGAGGNAGGTWWQVLPGPLRATDTVVEPDLNSAAPFLAAAVVTGGEVRVPGWPRRTSQPGAALPELLAAMGARAEVTDDGTLTVTGTGRVHGLTADLRAAGELVPVLTAVAAVADSPSRLTGVAHLRLQETDRLAALVAELTRLGGRARELPDGLVVEPVPLSPGVVETYDDHRIAMFAAVLGLVVPGLAIRDVATTGKTVPDFTGRWEAMLAGREYAAATGAAPAVAPAAPEAAG